jgi:adenylate cyclase
VSESTVSRLRGIYRTRDVDLVVVKGKSKPVRVLEVLDYHDETTFPNLLDVVQYFNEGVQHYRRAGWHAAAQRFKHCLKLNPGDALSQTYIERCQIMAANPPPRDWNGTWVMKEK